MKRFFLSLFLLSVLSLFSPLFASVGPNVKVIKYPTELEEKQIPLDCKWDYIDSRFFDPGYFYKNGDNSKISVYDYNGKLVSLPYALKGGIGFATYHCRIENLKPDYSYAILLYKSIYGAADLYVNGKPVYLSGSTSGNPNIVYKSLRHIKPVVFHSDKFGVADLVFHVSNYELSRGGILLVPKIATNHFTNIYLLKNIAFETLLFGVLIILALYNFLLFIMNRSQRMSLYIALLSLDLLIVSCTLDFSLFSYLTKDFIVGTHFKIVLISLSMIIPLYNLYVINLYEIKYKYNFIILILDFFVPAFFVFVPIIYSSSVVILMMTILYINSLILCWLILKNIRNPRTLYIFNVIVIVLMLFTALYGLLIGQYESTGNSGILLFKIAIMVFAICQSSFAGIKRDILSSENTLKLKQYEKFNESYKRFVPINVINYLQVEDVCEVEAGDNSICDGMIISGYIRAEMENASTIPGQKIFSIMARYYEGIENIVKEYDGFFSKSSANGFTIIFSEKTDKVVRCAVDIYNFAESMTEQIQHEVKMHVTVDIGIHVSKVVIGLVGNDNHLSTCECSAGIEEAMQISAMNKVLGCHILISEQALDYCRTYIGSLFEGVIVELDGIKTLIYKVIPFDNPNSNLEFLPGEE